MQMISDFPEFKHCSTAARPISAAAKGKQDKEGRTIEGSTLLRNPRFRNRP